MTNAEGSSSRTSVRDLTGRAYNRALPPKRWARIVNDWIANNDGESDSVRRAVAAGLLHHLTRASSPPALLLSYLSRALADNIFTARSFTLILLIRIHRSDSETPLSIPFLTACANAILTNPTGLGPNDVLDSPMDISDVPDVGTSASGSVQPVPVLTLVLPLIRLCSIALPESAPSKVVSLAARLTALIPPLPAPPFDVGLEAAQLSAMLPEDIAKPLRNCLVGLMSELPFPALQAAPDASSLFTAPSLTENGVSTMFGELTAPTGGMTALTPSSLRGPSSLPLRQGAAFLIEHAFRAHSWTSSPAYSTSDPPVPPAHHIHLLHLGQALSNEPQAFLLALLEASSGRVLSSWSHGLSSVVRPLVFFTDELPVLLRWWRDNADSKWPFPPNLQGALATVFSQNSASSASWFQNVNSIYTAKFSQSESDDEAGLYSQPDGWSLLSLETSAIRRYISLGLLDEDAAVSLVGSSAKPVAGESLLDCLVSASPSHLPALEIFITYACGTPRSLGSELVNCITASAQTPPPENLFSRLASSPTLLALLTACITPTSLLDLLVTNLLERAEDEAARADDPQACLIRFGSGVMLVEALCAQFDLPLPDLLFDARRAQNLNDLTDEERSHLNGWVKALFGSDGIDDQILLATSSQGLYRLASTLVQQSIIAAMGDQIDLDTLHSGLSYFSQPLLSWCLGGVVGWLCAEIERQGALSGLHLNVLQTLVLDSAFPEPLLRANAKAISRLLEPSTGLDPVLQSSGFDTVAVRARLQAAGGPDGNALLPDSIPVQPLAAFRSELQAVRHLDLAAPSWDACLLDTLDVALRSYGPLRTLEIIVADVLYPSIIDMEGTAGASGDPLAQFAALLTVLDLPRVSPTPMIHHLIDAYIPYLFTSRSPFSSTYTPTATSPPTPPLPFAAQAVYRLVRSALVAASNTYPPEMADLLASHLADELTYQRTRPSDSDKSRSKRQRTLGPPSATPLGAGAGTGSGSGAGTRSPPRPGAGAAPDPGLSNAQAELLAALSSALESDEEVRSRWPVLV